MRHQGLHCLGHAQEAVAGNIHGRIEAGFGGVDDAAVQVVAIAEGHRVNGEIKFTELVATLLDGGFKAAFFGDVELQEELCTDCFSEWLRVFGGLVVLVGQCNFATQSTDGLGHGIGDRLVVGNAGNQSLLAGQRQQGIHAGQGGLFIYCVHAVHPFGGDQGVLRCIMQGLILPIDDALSVLRRSIIVAHSGFRKCDKCPNVDL